MSWIKRIFGKKEKPKPQVKKEKSQDYNKYLRHNTNDDTDILSPDNLLSPFNPLNPISPISIWDNNDSTSNYESNLNESNNDVSSDSTNSDFGSSYSSDSSSF